MSAVIRDIRAFQSAVTKFKDKPNVYRSVVKDIVAEQRAGRNGFAAVRQARKAEGKPTEPGVA